MNQGMKDTAAESTEPKRRGTTQRANNSRLYLLAFFMLMSSVGAGMMFGPRLHAAETKPAAAATARPAMPVETVEVKVADSQQTLSAVGTLRSEESVMIVAELAGRIDKINFSEGERCSKGKLLIGLDSAVLQAELDRAQASRDLSQANYQRAEALLQDRAVSTRERDEAYARWQLDQASVRLAQAQLQKASISAPFAGTLGLRQVSLGDYVQPGRALVNLEAIDQLKVEFRLPEKYAAVVKSGQALALQSDAFPGRSFAGQVYAIDPLVEEQSRSLVLRGKLDNRKGELMPGQFVQVQLNISTKADALFIPEQALIPQPKVNLVFKVVDGKVEMVPVAIGRRVKGWVEIISGLAAGDVVVTGGHQKIGPGSPVHAMPADPALFAALN